MYGKNILINRINAVQIRAKTYLEDLALLAIVCVKMAKWESSSKAISTVQIQNCIGCKFDKRFASGKNELLPKMAIQSSPTV